MSFLGKLIAIEGIDGSGKGTQSQLLKDFLDGVYGCDRVKLFCFPQYEKNFFGTEVGKYLDGHYGSLDTVPPKFSALLYSLDRFESRRELLNSLNNEKIVICDRYTPSNIAHQSARLSDDLDKEEMIKWIEEVEYNILQLPRPDLVIFLDSSVQTSQSLVNLKNARTYTEKSHDLQESSKDHLQSALEQFRNLAGDRVWKTVSCLDKNGDIKSPLEIHAEIRDHVTKII